MDKADLNAEDLVVELAPVSEPEPLVPRGRSLHGEGPTSGGGSPGIDWAGIPDETPDPFQQVREALVLWHAPDGADEVAFATVEIGGGIVQHLKVRSRAFGKWLRAKLIRLGETPKRDALKDMVDALEALAQVEGEERVAYRRTGWHADGSLWIDLARKDHRVVRVDADGWEIRPMTKDAPLLVRTDSMAPMPIPTTADGRGLDSWLIEHLNLLGQDEAEEAIAEGQRHARFASSFCVSAMRPTPPYWHLQLVGEQGAAKTTAARLLKRITDPSAIEDIAPPKTHHDLAIVAKEQRVLSLDNLSKLTPEMSDTLARTATGATVANRGLYTDGDVAAFKISGAAILNGIPDVISKPDLAERTLTLVLQRPMRRKLDSEVSAAFERDHPKILASLLDGLTGVLAYRTDVIAGLDRARAPRMVEPFVWAEAAGRAWDWRPWQFLEDLERAQYDAAYAMVESDSLARAVTKAVRDHCRRTKQAEWKGQAQELRDMVKNAALDLQLPMEFFPQSPKGMSNALRRIAQPLRVVGWDVEHRWDGRDKDRAPRWTLRPPKGEKPAG